MIYRICQGLAAFEERRLAIREGTDRNQESMKVSTFDICITDNRLGVLVEVWISDH